MSRLLNAGLFLGLASACLAQEVCLPAPRLLTVLPMGAKSGSQLEVTLSGENLDEPGALLFSHSSITAEPKSGPDGKVIPNQFVVTIGPEAPIGVHEARLQTRLGLSSPRAFSISHWPEVTRTAPNNSLNTALQLQPDSLCNAFLTKRAVDFYSFNARKDQHLLLDCAAAGIDSRTRPVLILSDSSGRELLTDRNGGVLDFTAPADGKYFLKVHDLTFQGGPQYFYRLGLFSAQGVNPNQPTTRAVGAFSWKDDADAPKLQELDSALAQKVSLPCQIEGRFFPSADVDTFEFEAKKAEVWWVEVVSERLGLPTNPFALVQRITNEGGNEKSTDLVELNDIASPIKPSTNGYSYDGPPYEAGSADLLGKLQIKEDGLYRLHLRDLFGGTRSDPRNLYRLIIRKPAPDFTLVAWAFHKELRNGDRAALSKPIALRAGATMAFEVVALRRDGFNGEIELGADQLPPGVSAAGVNIPADSNRGMLLISAREDSVSAFSIAQLFGRAKINQDEVRRPCQLASMIWPVKDASQEIPTPRLLADAAVSVTHAEFAPVSIAPAEPKTWEAKVGEKLTIPLKLTWRGEFSGSLKLKAFGNGFEGVKEFEIPLKAESAEAVLDLAALKIAAGEYTVAFYGSMVAKYRNFPEAVKSAEAALTKASEEAGAAQAGVIQLAEAAKTASPEFKAAADKASQTAAEQQKRAEAAKTEAAKLLKAATDRATPKDTVDIVVSEPIRIAIHPVENK